METAVIKAGFAHASLDCCVAKTPAGRAVYQARGKHPPAAWDLAMGLV